MSEALARLAVFYREQVKYWEEQERRWKEAKVFCHQKVLEIQVLRKGRPLADTVTRCSVTLDTTRGLQ